jgi:F-type H+-transporting ATPase subunit gamma
MPSLKDLRTSHRQRPIDAEDHQGHEDGRGVEAAPRAGAGRSGAALCRAHGAVLGKLAAGVAGSAGAPRCWPAPARTRCICWSSAPATAACAARSTPIDRARWRASAPTLDAEGKTVKILCVGRKGRDQLRRELREASSNDVELRRQVRRVGFADARGHRRQDHRAMFEAGEFDVCTLSITASSR